MIARDYDGLVRYLEATALVPFAWEGDETQDCIRFGLRGIEAQAVPLPEGVPTWKTAKQALKLLNERGGVAGAIGSVLPEIAPAMAQRGDIGLIENDGNETCCIVEGAMVVAPVEPVGVKRFPRRAMTRAWSVG